MAATNGAGQVPFSVEGQTAIVTGAGSGKSSPEQRSNSNYPILRQSTF